MGQFCSGGTGPDLDVNTDRITEMINESLAEVAKTANENFEAFTAGVAGAGDDPFTVPDSDVELNKESTEQDIGRAAVAAAFAGADTANLKDSIWKEVEQHLDEQIAAMEEEKRPADEEVAASKQEIRDRDVDEAVGKAFADKQAELESAYDPEPAEEEKPGDDEKAGDEKEDAAAAEEQPADDAAEEKPAAEAAEEAPAAEPAAEEEAAAADEEPAAQEPAAEEPAAEEPAAEEAAAEEE